jgi:phospholipase C
MKIVNHTSRTIYLGVYTETDLLYTFTWRFVGARQKVGPNQTYEWDTGNAYRVQVIIWNTAMLGTQAANILAGPRTLFTARGASFAEDANGLYLYNHLEGPRTMDKIEHVFVLMLENRSFDNLLGWLYADRNNQPNVNIPAQNPPRYDGLVENAYWNTEVADAHDRPDARRIYARKGATSLTKPDPNPPEVCPRFIEQMFGTEAPSRQSQPNMWGFVQAYGTITKDLDGIMECYTPDQLPWLSTIAKQYAVCDRWFGSAPCETFPNRAFVHAGSSFGRLNNMNGKYNEGDRFPDVVPNFVGYSTARTIFDVLEGNSLPYAIISVIPFMTQVGFQFFPVDKKVLRSQFSYSIAELQGLIDPGAVARPNIINASTVRQLPRYIFIEPDFIKGDQHPPHDVRIGDAFIQLVYKIIQSSPVWHKSMLIITYDEHGGCYDHVPPPTAVPPDNTPLQFPVGDINPFAWYGPRVPTVVVSPYIEPGTVFRGPGIPYDHTSILASLRDWIFGTDAGDSFFHNPRIQNAPTLWGLLTRSIAREVTAAPMSGMDVHTFQGGIDELGPLGDSVKDIPLNAEQLSLLASGDALQRLRMEAPSEPADVLEKRYAEMTAENVARLVAHGVRTVGDADQLFTGKVEPKPDATSGQEDASPRTDRQ